LMVGLQLRRPKCALPEAAAESACDRGALTSIVATCSGRGATASRFPASFLVFERQRYHLRVRSILFPWFFFLIRQQLADTGGRHGDVMPALGEHVVNARHANDHVFRIGDTRFQRQDIADLRVVEIAEHLANVG
jgi:hypothetical protein